MNEKELKTIDTIVKWINNDEESYCTGKDIKDKIKIKIEEYTDLLNTLNKKADIERIKAINERILAFKEILEDKE